MESHRNHRVPIVVLLILGLASGVASADETSPPDFYERFTTTVVYSTPDAAVIEAETVAKHQPTTAAPSRKSGRSCRLQKIETGPSGPNNVSIPVPEGKQPYWVVCDGAEVGIVFRDINPTAGRPSVPPGDIAMDLREEIPMPQVVIRVNPDVGLVGTESWFWVEGYGGAPITHSTDAFGQMVEVVATPSRYEWSFGDGAVQTSQVLGRPYPNRSEIRHTYQRSSEASAEGFQVQVRFLFSVRYRVAGGPWVDVPGIMRSAQFRFRVQESQAVISR